MKFPPGTKVAFSREFLSNISDLSYERASARGEVLEEDPSGYLLLIRWSDGSEGYVNHLNLVEADKLHLEK